ncbi:30S ribosomal protein S6 [Spiroplasma clarkii]|uniref:Small ribosomal subunit protein bS6 n=1 Tax=Spiroplasma clarkii TaxID=2139 RepID=A0A1Y0KZK9_9MOLU|nr:30S ribosomal protein S6 [Spiroplasma clarkii]ARU90908.1 30S ribosomal protein S6 [Spiroplasma clarkii]ATX70359.1 30S ribosomal protein S6 [Spiroplasma clarkii]
MIRKYEIMYIVDEAADQKAIAAKLNDILTANGGKILASDEWGLKEFAYEINKKKKGFYTVLIVETDSANILEFQRIVRIDNSIIRELVINTETEKKYIQSTKLSKTDMSKFKEEKKPTRSFDRRPPRKFEDKPGERRPATEAPKPADTPEVEKPKPSEPNSAE